jgi:hypothetical protein
MRKCKICNSPLKYVFSAILLKKYKFAYFYCQNCGFLQTESPYWLKEAYSNAITGMDTGLVQRNIHYSRIISCLLFLFFRKNGKYLDVGGGCGMFTRLMRDYGFDFYWSDKYCENILAKGFEDVTTEPPFEAVISLEVMEHIHDPVFFLEQTIKQYETKSIIFSTELYNGAPPNPENWYYYALNTGQHISFYQEKTLKFISDKIDLNLYTYKNIHILTDKHINMPLFKLICSPLLFIIFEYVKIKLTSNTLSDHQILAHR